MFRICKRYTFEAAHHLPQHKGKCRRPHGHSYKVDIVLAGNRLQQDGSSQGMLLDFDDLDHVMRPIIEGLDHQNLNDVIHILPPTAENIVGYISSELEEAFGSEFAQLDSIRVWETEKSWAEWSRA